MNIGKNNEAGEPVGHERDHVIVVKCIKSKDEVMFEQVVQVATIIGTIIALLTLVIMLTDSDDGNEASVETNTNADIHELEVHAK